MKDITKDLQERIDEIRTECAQIQRRMDLLIERERILTSMLEDERMRWPGQPTLPGLERTNGLRLSSPLSRFLIETLSTHGPQSLEELKRRALDHGLDFSRKNPGRTLNFALVGMKQHSMVERLDTGQWKLADRKDGSD
jgi:uncharacterized protein YceH (UPF0502 family)